MPKYYQGNYEAMREYLSNITWNCSQENWNTIKKTMFYITEQFIPKRQTSDKEHKARKKKCLGSGHRAGRF